MRDPRFSQHLTEQLGDLDGDRADQYRLPLRVRFLDCFHNRFELFFFESYKPRPPDQLSVPDSLVGISINVHAVNVTELLFLSEGRTCHTGSFFRIY